MMKKYYENEQVQDTLHIYTRVSTCQQVKSLDTQKELGEKKAKELGMKSKVWSEVGSSLHKDLKHRRILWELLNEVHNGSAKHLFVVDIHRLSRDQLTMHPIKVVLENNDVILYTKDGQYDLYNRQDAFIKTLFEGLASYENALREKRSRKIVKKEVA